MKRSSIGSLGMHTFEILRATSPRASARDHRVHLVVELHVPRGMVEAMMEAMVEAMEVHQVQHIAPHHLAQAGEDEPPEGIKDNTSEDLYHKLNIEVI